MSYQDSIDNLPTDDIPPSEEEKLILNTLINDNSSVCKKEELKSLVILLILFIVISLDPVKNIINKYISISQKSPYIDILIRGFILVIAFYLVKIFLLKNNK